MPKPLLSIGIIFKNEIRCLERCLKSLAPLRDVLACEVVMADTGSSDGSRTVAEKYADILFDFPWINDFAAARNAVMDRCSGRWYLSIDADEWLDDVEELAFFLRSNNRKDLESCTICVRNYLDADDFSSYNDFYVTRLLRMSTGVRYEGAVHERWRKTDGSGITSITLHNTILHHDGYVGLNEEAGQAKRQRNQALLNTRLEKDPENVRLLLQYIESSRPDPQHMDYIHRGIAATVAKREGWSAFGPAVFRYAVLAARERALTELENQWIHQALELFPQSFYTNIDIALVAFVNHWDKKQYSECIPWGEKYLSAMDDYAAGRGDKTALRVSTLTFASPSWVWKVQTAMAVCYRKTGHPEQSIALLAEIEPLDDKVVMETLADLQELQVSTGQDTAASILRLYERITTEPDENQAKELMTAFVQTASQAFNPDAQIEEAEREDFHRHGFTVYMPLAGKCEIGTAAAAMETKTDQEMEKLLSTVQNWENFPDFALLRVLEKGASFPPAEQTLRAEEMERIAKRLSRYKDRFFDMVCQTALSSCSDSWQKLIWTRSMVFAAMQAFNWQDEKQGLALAETFVKVMWTFVSRCYAPEVLCEENIQVLPPLHRFGWYSGRAFQALESGNAARYVRLLRSGLETCPEMKVMVEFLTEHTPQLKPSPSQELMALAEQVRTLLAAYDPEDPAVLAIKQSPVYQKVAHLIEGIEVPVAGGLVQ